MIYLIDLVYFMIIIVIIYNIVKKKLFSHYPMKIPPVSRMNDLTAFQFTNEHFWLYNTVLFKASLEINRDILLPSINIIKKHNFI
jgi:hypothetical protein